MFRLLLMVMQKLYATIEELIKCELNDDEDAKTLNLMSSLAGVLERGYFNKEEFLRMGMWKSARPKQKYLKNSEAEIKSTSRKVLDTKFEKRRIVLLTKLHGVLIPTASAILTLIDPQNYGVIDIRVWKVLYLYGSVKDRPKGTNFDFNNWYNYLMKLRFVLKNSKFQCETLKEQSSIIT